MKPVVAVVVTGCLVWVVVALGARRLPAELSPLTPTWDFTEGASPWTSRNSQVVRTPNGLTVTPTATPALLSSGQIEHDPAAFERMRVRMKARDATEGRVGLVLRGPDGLKRVLASFEVPGGGIFADIVVPLAVTRRADIRVIEVVLAPSVAVQPTVVASISFEPDGAWLTTAVRELWSRSPGEAASLSGFTMHTLPPPVIGGRSAWWVLMPVVVLAGAVARCTRGATGLRRVLRRCAWGAVGTVWGIGCAWALYHQTVALAVDVKRFGDRGRAEAYRVIDGVPLRDDLLEAARWLPQGATVEFVTDGGGDPVVSALWAGRAAYYLAPIVVHSQSPLNLQYFGAPHPPCVRIASGREVLNDAVRYCLFRSGS